MSKLSCPLCSGIQSKLIHEDATRTYHQCPNCALIFVPAEYHIQPPEEKSRYEQHRNDPNDARYREFLNRLLIPLQQHLQPGQQGLDFGCGPTTPIEIIMEERGFKMQSYDLYFAKHKNLLTQTYDFITCSEVVEHFRQPAEGWRLLESLFTTHTCLAVMTQRPPLFSNFTNWYYLRDPTHVVFYPQKTMEWIAHRFDWRLESIGENVSLFFNND